MLQHLGVSMKREVCSKEILSLVPTKSISYNIFCIFSPPSLVESRVWVHSFCGRGYWTDCEVYAWINQRCYKKLPTTRRSTTCLLFPTCSEEEEKRQTGRESSNCGDNVQRVFFVTNNCGQSLIFDCNYSLIFFSKCTFGMISGYTDLTQGFDKLDFCPYWCHLVTLFSIYSRNNTIDAKREGEFWSVQSVSTKHKSLTWNKAQVRNQEPYLMTAGRVL